MLNFHLVCLREARKRCSCFRSEVTLSAMPMFSNKLRALDYPNWDTFDVNGVLLLCIFVDI